MSTRVTNQERDPLELGHDQQEERVEEEESPMEEELWIEQREALQVEVSQEVKPLVDSCTRIQSIVEEQLRLGSGDFGI